MARSARAGLGPADRGARRTPGAGSTRRDNRAARSAGSPSRVMVRNSSMFCQVRAMPGARAAVQRQPVDRLRLQQIAPASGRTTPEIRLNSEVLPAPFGPIRPRISPACDRQVDVVGDDDAAERLAQPVDAGLRSCASSLWSARQAAGISPRPMHRSARRAQEQEQQHQHGEDDALHRRHDAGRQIEECDRLRHGEQQRPRRPPGRRSCPCRPAPPWSGSPPIAARRTARG